MKKYKKIAFQVDLARQMETPETLKKIIDFGASAGYNELVLYGEGSLEFKCHPECSKEWYLKQDEFIKLRDYAENRYAMRLVPVIPVLGHANFVLKNPELEHLSEVKDNADAVMKCNMRQFCSSNPESYKLIEELLKEWLVITTTPYIHIGGDESWNFALCPECRKKADKVGRGKMLAEYFNRVNAIVKSYGKKTMIWHDMLFYYDDCLPHLNKDIIICDWHYKPIERHPGISIYNWRKTDFLREYEKEKLSVYICPKSKFAYSEETSNIRTFIEYSEERKVDGFLNTVWEMSCIPYASCYPSLAYGGACCNGSELPEPRQFLNGFISKHFSTGREFLPLLIDLFEQTAQLPVFTGLDNWITYQDPGEELELAGKLNEAVTLIRKVKPKTIPGKAYKETLELIFRRLAISERLHGLVKRVARTFFSQGKPSEKQIRQWLGEMDSVLKEVPGQIKREQKIWNKYRPKAQINPIVKQFTQAETEFPKFIRSVRSILAGKTKPASVFPRVLELTLVNNDCSWQYLRISSSVNQKKYVELGAYPQCGPFGRYIKTYKLPHKATSIKLELSGLGQLLVHYVRIIGLGTELVPEKILKVSGNVEKPENMLIDDFTPVILGKTESKEYFSKGKEQPLSMIEVKFPAKALRR